MSIVGLQGGSRSLGRFSGEFRALSPRIVSESATREEERVYIFFDEEGAFFVSLDGEREKGETAKENGKCHRVSQKWPVGGRAANRIICPARRDLIPSSDKSFRATFISFFPFVLSVPLRTTLVVVSLCPFLRSTGHISEERNSGSTWLQRVPKKSPVETKRTKEKENPVAFQDF